MRYVLILCTLVLICGTAWAGDCGKFKTTDSMRFFAHPTWLDPPARPTLTIFYVDTVGWKQSTKVYYPPYRRPDNNYLVDIVCDTTLVAEYVKVWLPILDTVVVGTVYIDKLPDKHKLLQIRKAP